MSFLFPSPKAPVPPPPPPSPPMITDSSIAEQGAAKREQLNDAQGAGFSGTDVTGGQGAKDPNTTAPGFKALLGGGSAPINSILEQG